MKPDTFLALLAAALGGLFLARWLKRAAPMAMPPAGVAMHAWENEGGALAGAASPGGEAH